MKFEFAYNLDGKNSTPAIISLPVADNQTLKAGDPVALSSGRIVKGADGFGRAVGVMAEDITTGASAGGPKAKVMIATPSQVWKAKSASDATSVVLGARTVDLNSSQQVNPVDTTGGCIQVIQLGDTNTDVFVHFTATELT